MSNTPQLGDVLDRGIRVTDRVIADLEAELDIADPERRQKISSQISMMLRALAPVIKESRQLAKDAQDWAENMTQAEQRLAFRDFFSLMPVEQQRDLLQELTRELNAKRASK